MRVSSSWSPLSPSLQGLCFCWRAWDHLIVRWSLAYHYVPLPSSTSVWQETLSLILYPILYLLTSQDPQTPVIPSHCKQDELNLGEPWSPSPCPCPWLLPHRRRRWSQCGEQGQYRSCNLVKRGMQCFYRYPIIWRFFSFVCCLNHDVVTGS